MTAQTKTVIKSYFETGDRPTQAQFVDFIDSYQDYDATLTSLTSAASGIIVKSSAGGVIARTITASAASLINVGNGSGVGADISFTLPASVDLTTRATLVATASAASNDTTAASTAFVISDRRVLQQVRTETGAVATGTTVLPYDDTVPQNGEGDQYMTLAITPKSATSILVIQVVAICTHSTAANMTMALFQDAIGSALAAVGFSLTGGGYVTTLPLVHKMTSGTTSSTTFKVGIGGGGAGTTTFNGSGGARLFGGVAASSITITEYSA